MVFLFEKIKRSRPIARWLSVLVGLNFTLLAVFLGRQVQIRHHYSLAELIESDARGIEVALIGRLREKISSLEAIANRWMVWGEQNPKLWQAETLRYMQSYSYILALAHLDSESKMQWVIPNVDTEDISRLHREVQLYQQRVIADSQIFGETQIADLIELKDSNEQLNPVLLIYTPLIEDGKFEGWLVAVLHVDTVFNGTLKELAQLNDYQISLAEGEGKIYQTNPPQNPNSISRHQLAYAQTFPVAVAGASWRIEIIPSLQFLWEHQTNLPGVIFWGGFVFSGLLGFTVHLLQGRTRQLNQITHLNRSLLTLSECNQALIRAATERELLDEVCRILVEIGGFDGVRVGFVQPEGESLCWVADSCAGRSCEATCESIVNGIDRSTAAVLQTGIHAITVSHFNDGSGVLKTTHVAQFPLLKRASGNPSVPADLPDDSAPKNGNVFGVLILKSTPKEAFDEAEIPLLQELASDLAYGINTLRTRRARRESEEKFRQIAENMQDVLFVRSVHPPEMLYINPAYEKIWGTSSQEIYQRHDAWLDAVHPDDREPVLEKLRPFLDSGEMTIEYRIVRPDGEVRWISSKAFPLYNERGEVYRSVGIASDMSDRKRAEEQLAKLSERLQLALKSGDIGIWEWDVVNNVLTWDRRMYELYGIDPSTFQGVYEAWSSALHPEDRVQAELFSQQVLRGEKEYDTEFRIVHPDGSIHYIKADALIERNQAGEPLRMTGINYEITERKQAEIARQQKNELLQTILDHIPVMISLFDREGKLQWVNPEWENVLGWKLEEIRDMNLLAEFYPDPEYRQSVIDFIQTAEKTWGDFQTRVRDGRFLEITWANAKLSDGSSLCIGQDITERKRAEIALKEQKELLENIFEHIPVMVALMDSQHNFLWVNPEWEKVSGYKFEEISQFDVWSYGFPDPEYRQYILEKLEAELGNWIDIKIRVRNGRITEQTWMNTYLSDGKILAIGQDITERKREEEILRKSEERLRQVLENMSVMLDAFDERGNIIVWNKACERVTGYTAAEIVNNPDAMKLLYPDEKYRQEMIAAWKVRGDNYYDWEWNLTAKDGSVKAVSWTNISEVYPVPGWASWGVGIDVTERKRNEEKERLLYEINRAMTAAEDLDSALEIALSFICESINWDLAEAWIPDEEMEQLELCTHFYSKSAEFEPFFFGSLQLKLRQHEGLSGRVWASKKPQWLSPLSQQSDEAYLRKKLAKLANLETALAVPILLESQVVAIFGFYTRETCYRNQNLIELICTLGERLALTVQRRRIEQDVRELNHRLEQRVKLRTAVLEATNQALKEAKATADAANQAKSTFLAQMSHELRTPLNGILGYTQILQRDRTLTEGHRQSLSIIYNCSQHLLDLINDILDLAKIEAEKMELHPSLVHLRTFLDEISIIFHPKADAKGLTWSYSVDPQLWNLCCLADKKRLRQILLNLLSNAIKFTERGEVMFAVKAVSGFKNTDRSVTLGFKIQDTGIGISAEGLERLFQPFAQGAEAHKQSEGTGLGLTITQKLLEMMGSELQVRSESNRGSLFSFDLQLPIIEGVEPLGIAHENSRSILGIAGKSPRILVVDDRLENCAFLQEFLSSIGFQVEIASNGKIGLEKMELLHPDLDLLIVDFVMPEMGGLEMIANIRQNPAYEKVKIIVASASGLIADQVRCLESGCDGFLFKPVDCDELLKKLGELLEIEWIYSSKEDVFSANKITRFDDSFPVNIDSTLLENLYELALDGKIKQIKQEALNLKNTDPIHASFAEILLELANNCQEKEICQLVEKYRSQRYE